MTASAPSGPPTRRPRATAWALVAVVSVVGVLAVGCSSTTSVTSPSSSTAPATSAAPTTTWGAASAAIDPALGVSTSPVRPTYDVVSATFEGFQVRSFVPPAPRGIVYLFHGTGGGADFATKVETVDVLNGLVARGYGFVATESSERTDPVQWDMTDPSITTNRDLARMVRLRRHVIDTTPVSPDTPTFGIGMSNGSAFVALWATALVKAGIPVKAIAMYMAGVTRATNSIGGVPVPTFMVVAANDTVTSPTKEKADLAAIAHRGIPTELHEVRQRPVVAARYLRVPGVTPATAADIVRAYQAAGLIDSTGRLAVPPGSIGDKEAQKAAAKGVRLPSTLSRGQRLEVQNETKAMIAEHQFNAEFKVQNRDFFDSHR